MSEKILKDTERIEMMWDYISSSSWGDDEIKMDRWDDGYDIQINSTDKDKVETLWNYINNLNFNGDMEMNQLDGGYEIIFTWKDWSKKDLK